MEEKKKIVNIHLIEVAKMLKADFKMIRNYTLIAGLIGVILAFATPKIYKSTVILAPEESGSSFSGSISSLAAMVGMNMKIGQTGDALYPEIYPDIMESTGFLVGMFPVNVKKKDSDETYTYYDYLDKHQRLAFYDYPLDWLAKLKEMFNDPVFGGQEDQRDYHRRGRSGPADSRHRCRLHPSAPAAHHHRLSHEEGTYRP